LSVCTLTLAAVVAMSYKLLQSVQSVSSRANTIPRTNQPKGRHSDKWPAVVHIFVKDETKGLTTDVKSHLLCAGVLISEQWVVTSARCLYTEADKRTNTFTHKLKKDSLGIAVGYYDLSQRPTIGTTTDVKQMIIHEGFESSQLIPNFAVRVMSQKANDIALLELSSPLTFQHLEKTASLTNDESLTMSREDVTQTGWSSIIPTTVSDQLQEDYAFISTNEQKVENTIFHLIEINPITSNSMRYYTACCIATTGAPLFKFKDGRWYAIGIYTHTLDNGTLQYANLVLHYSWIKMMSNVGIQQGTL